MPNTYDFTGRVALVTGGASGIGAAVAERLRGGGARVVTFDRDLLRRHPGRHRRLGDLDGAVEQVEEQHGRLDILVNSAGIPGESLRTVDVTDEEWERVLAVNATGSFYACRAVLPGHDRARLRPHRARRLDRRQGGQPDGGRLLRVARRP